MAGSCGCGCGDGQGGESSLGEGKDDVGKGRRGRRRVKSVWLKGSRGEAGVDADVGGGGNKFRV